MGVTIDLSKPSDTPLPVSLDSYIAIADHVLGGKPHIAGRRIAVSHIAEWHLVQQRSLGDIAYDFDLPLPAVYAAIAYYLSHKDEIDQQDTEDENFVEQFKRQHADLINPLQRKLASQ